jgi:hypothetical protein
VVKRFSRATWTETFQTLKNSMQILRDFAASGDIPAELEQFEIMGAGSVSIAPIVRMFHLMHNDAHIDAR